MCVRESEVKKWLTIKKSNYHSIDLKVSYRLWLKVAIEKICNHINVNWMHLTENAVYDMHLQWNAPDKKHLMSPLYNEKIKLIEHLSIQSVNVRKKYAIFLTEIVKYENAFACRYRLIALSWRQFIYGRVNSQPFWTCIFRCEIHNLNPPTSVMTTTFTFGWIIFLLNIFNE